MPKSATATPAPASPATAPFQYRLGQVIRGARHAHDRYRRQAKLTRALGWPDRKLLDIELGRVKPSPADLELLTRELPLLSVVLGQLRPAQHKVESAGHV